jgi:hypothetical protein
MSNPLLRMCHRVMLGIDAEGSTQRLDPGRGYLRDAMYAALDEALGVGGITRDCRDDYLDRGDGAMALIHPVDAVPKTVVLDTVVPKLAALLTEHNARYAENAFRLRVVVSAGEVTYDDNGPYGDALDVAFRLLDASGVKKMLKGTEDPMVLVVSEEIYDSVVRHGYEGIDADSFTRVRTRKVSGRSRVGWARPMTASRDEITPRDVVSLEDLFLRLGRSTKPLSLAR